MAVFLSVVALFSENAPFAITLMYLKTTPGEDLIENKNAVNCITTIKTLTMKTKTGKIIGWVLTGLLAVVFIASAIGKFTLSDQMLKQAAMMGFSARGIKLLGVLEIVCFILFVIPRTGVLGTLLLAAYIGGAIATHIEHSMPAIMPLAVECVIFITAIIRFPELSIRLLGKTDTR